MGLETLEGLAARAATVAASRVGSPATAARGAMAEMEAQVLLEQISAAMALPGRQVVRAALVAMAVTPPRVSRATAAQVAMAVSPEPAVLVSAQSLRAKVAAMVATEATAALPELGERAAPPAMR